MDAEQTKVFATVRSPHFASAALAATDVRFNGASITGAKPSRIPGHFHDFARKLVTQNARVCVYGVSPCKSMKITSTNADPMNSNQGLSTGRRRAWDHDVDKLAWSIQQDSSHKKIP